MGIDRPLTEPDSATSDRTPRGAPRARRYLLVTGVVVAVLFGLSATALAGVRIANRGEILRGVTIEGVDVGGLSPVDARRALQGLATGREGDPVEFTLEGKGHVLEPSDIGYRVELEATIANAMSVGRGAGVVANTIEHVRAYWVDRQVELVASHDDEALAAWVGSLAEDLDRQPTIGAVSVDPDSLETEVTYPQDGVTLRPDEIRSAALRAFGTPGPDRLPLPADIEPTPVSRHAVDRVARRARRAVAAPLQLDSPESGTSLTLAPSEIARLIRLRPGADEGSVELGVTKKAVRSVLGDRVERFRVEPVSARFDVPRQPPTQLDDKDDVTWRPRPADVAIVPATDGWRFHAGRAARQLTRLLQDGRRQAELRLAVVEPDLTTEAAEDLGITELLGTFTTHHACCANRVHNIQKLADMVDHTLVLPGEQFSINQISGHRTCAKGFVEDGMILNGEVVPVCGGGVSQFGTTTVNAVFFSGLDPDTYKPHSFYISRYPMGREATLNYPSPDIDVRFTNDTGHGILVKTWYTPTSITVSFYGQNDVEQVTAIHGQPYNYKPYPTRERINRSLPPESRRVVQGGQQGFSITVTRVITYDDGSTAEDDWSNVYSPEIEIVEYNPEKAPEPEPDEDDGDKKKKDGGGGDGSDGG